MPQTGHIEKIIAHADEKLKPAREGVGSRSELIALYKRFLKIEYHRIKLLHNAGGGGVEIARKRSNLLDVVLHELFDQALCLTGSDTTSCGTNVGGCPVSLIATGGYGRGQLNPGSDIDLLFIHSDKRSLNAAAKEVIEQVLLMLWDVGFKVGHAVRSIKETLRFANSDHQTKTALLDVRLITGSQELYDDFRERFQKDCIEGKDEKYLQERAEDIRERHKKFSKTVYLQEPNIKGGCGGLRDYHNICWVLQVKTGSRDLKELVQERRLTKSGYNQLRGAYEFLMRVRNDMHYSQKRPGDILTLRLQGIVATNLGYPQKSILRRVEAFMKDYYHHTRNLYQITTSLMQAFELELEEERKQSPVISFLARRGEEKEHFDGFYSKGGLIYPESLDTFKQDPNRMMRCFLHTQQRHLMLSPAIRRSFKRNYALINRPFRYSKDNRETFEQILQNRGDVGRVLRQMHRVGFLGRYLPEFGALTDLVQHEFFHRYTADEHTLRCIDQLDSVVDSDDPEVAFFQRIFRELEDPFILYLALILHDTGRSENYRHHVDASALLASKVCNRLHIRGDRRSRLIFLVDHHLTFWRTSTTMNLEDPNTIATFARAMRNQSYMETLMLFTYVDSKGTSTESWNGWKQSLMQQLYRSTSEYFKDQQAFVATAQRSKDELKQKVRAKLPPHFADEVEAHFDSMPERYFRFRSSTSVVRHVRLFHKFFKDLRKEGDETLFPLLNWEARPEEGYSLVEACCWNRQRLLAKVVGALTTRNLNIISADIFTRSDDLVLDIFRVCTTDFGPVTNQRDIKAVEKLLKEEFDLSDNAADFRELIAKAQQPSRYRETAEVFSFPQRVYLSNHLSPEYTVLEIQAVDRIGLLYDILMAVAGLEVEIVHSRISTQKGAAIDSFYLTDEKGGKLTDTGLRNRLQKAVENAVGI